jgi:hypothetical protein
MPPPDLTDEDLDVIVRYARRKFDTERWPLSAEMRPIREALEKLAPKRAPSLPPKVYAPPRATAKQRRGRDPRS